MDTNQITRFDFHGANVRVLTDEHGEPWFVGKDVATILGYKDTFDALKKHVDKEDKQNRQNDSFDSPRARARAILTLSNS